MDSFEDFQRGFDRHIHNLGYVPPEFQDHGKFDLDEPPEFIWSGTPARMRQLMPMREWQGIEDAAVFAHRRAPGLAEEARRAAGYAGVSDYHVPDQRPLLQGGDNNPLD